MYRLLGPFLGLVILASVSACASNESYKVEVSENRAKVTAYSGGVSVVKSVPLTSVRIEGYEFIPTPTPSPIPTRTPTPTPTPFPPNVVTLSGTGSQVGMFDMGRPSRKVTFNLAENLVHGRAGHVEVKLANEHFIEREFMREGEWTGRYSQAGFGRRSTLVRVNVQVGDTGAWSLIFE